VLRLDYSKLKRQMTPVNAPVPRPPPTFVEFLASQQSPCACIIELEGPRGTMRIEWNGATAPDLCGLSRALGGGRVLDPDRTKDPHPGRGRAHRCQERHRWARTAMPGEAVIASILWQSVHLPKPAGAAIKLLMFDGQAQKGTCMTVSVISRLTDRSRVRVRKDRSCCRGPVGTAGITLMNI
jgi:hypothetical protein